MSLPLNRSFGTPSVLVLLCSPRLVGMGLVWGGLVLESTQPGTIWAPLPTSDSPRSLPGGHRSFIAHANAGTVPGTRTALTHSSDRAGSDPKSRDMALG